MEPIRRLMTPPTAPTAPVVAPLVYTAQEVADLLKINRDSVRLATVNGTLPHRNLGATSRSIRYTREDIEVFLGNQARVGVGRPDSRYPSDRVEVMAAPIRRRAS